MLDTVLSILVLAGIILLVGAAFMWRKGAPRKQVVLMVILALIAFANVAIWTVPSADGTVPVEQIAE